MRRFKDESGIVVIVALVLLATLTLIGATAFFSAHITPGPAGITEPAKRPQVAMAGAENAREVLRATNLASTNTTNFSQELAAAVGADGVLSGYTATTDDSPLVSSSTLVNGYTYNAYLTNDSSEGASNTTDTNGKVVLTSVATGPANSKAIVTMTVQLYSLSSTSPAVVYSKDNVTLNGSAISINGTDSGTCGGSNLPPSTQKTRQRPRKTGVLRYPAILQRRSTVTLTSIFKVWWINLKALPITL